MSRLLFFLVIAWGTLGVCGLLAFSVQRLTLRAWQVFDNPMDIGYWLGLSLWVVFMAYSEGYKGFQKSFSPRVAARLLWLAEHPRGWLLVLAPIYAMGLIYATPKRLLVSYCILFMVIGLIITASFIPYPWRNILDFGVAVGLLWGTLATFWAITQAVIHTKAEANPDLP